MDEACLMTGVGRQMLDVSGEPEPLNGSSLITASPLTAVLIFFRVFRGYRL